MVKLKFLITQKAITNLRNLLIVFVISSFSFSASAKVYLNQNEFVSILNADISVTTNQAESNSQWQNRTLWLKKGLQKQIKTILDHKYPKLRLRYKVRENSSTPNDITTVWFLDEIGKERPITFGIAIKNDQIKLIKVLEFRESRGYEISIPEFSKQYDGVGLNESGHLNKKIDGITGATMSVNAMKKISRLAIFLHKTVLQKL